VSDRNGDVDLWQFAVCGLLGGALVIGMEFISDVKTNKGELPDEWKRSGWILAQLVRVALGGVLAGLFAHSDQISGALGAAGVGAAAPVIIEKLSQFVQAGQD
jgi:hypothetical protein